MTRVEQHARLPARRVHAASAMVVVSAGTARVSKLAWPAPTACQAGGTDVITPVTAMWTNLCQVQLVRIYPYFYGFIRLFTDFAHQLRTKSEKYGRSRRRGKYYGGFERYTEISRKIRRLRSLPTDCCKVDLEVLQVWFRPLPSASLRLLRHQPQLTPWCHRAPGLVREKLRIPN